MKGRAADIAAAGGVHKGVFLILLATLIVLNDGKHFAHKAIMAL